MFAIMTSQKGDSAIFYGPFTSEESAERYAKYHKIWGACCIVRLHDSGDAMDY